MVGNFCLYNFKSGNNFDGITSRLRESDLERVHAVPPSSVKILVFFHLSRDVSIFRCSTHIFYHLSKIIEGVRTFSRKSRI